ncbi:MAG: IS1634 family transposase [Acidobacteria bacterium]|nr:IS1634 family transposase [Planctomycetota bacterium]MBI3679763.1 IS1634 family transposase [Acidobacteriota bacterium]
MASLIAKKKGNQLYYYVVESARVDGKPRIVHQTYLGSAEKVAALVKDRTAPLPLSASARDFGLPGALWLSAQQTGVWALLESLWPASRSGPSPALYLLLAAIHRICQPGPKTEVSDWYRGTILHSLWKVSPERFTSQAFWDVFEQILPAHLDPLSPHEDPLDHAQLRLLGVWKHQQMVSRRLLSYDTTNFYTYIASTNTRNHLAQRGHNKQGRHNLRQVGLSYVLDGEHGVSLCHHVYRGNVADAEEFSTALARMLTLLDRNHIARDTVTLVFDKGGAALANTVQLEEAGVGWISALPWNQAPAQFRERDVEQLPPCSSVQPGVRAAAEKFLVHGQEYLCVVKYSASFAGEQLHSLTTSLSKVLQSLRRFSMELNKPKARWKEQQIRSKIQKWLNAQFLEELIRYQIQQRDGRWRLQFDFDTAAWQRLVTHRLGRTMLLTNRMDWTAEQVAVGYSAQQEIEKVFRGLKDGDWLGWGPMYHWTDRKIRIHAFYCMLGISLLQHVHKQAQAAWEGISVEQLLEELRHMQQFVLLYPPQGEKGPNRIATVLSKQTLPQQALAQTLGLDQLHITQRG